MPSALPISQSPFIRLQTARGLTHRQPGGGGSTSNGAGRHRPCSGADLGNLLQSCKLVCLLPHVTQRRKQMSLSLSALVTVWSWDNLLRLPLYAYIDPNTAGILSQILTPLLITAGMCVTFLRKRIVALFSGIVRLLRRQADA